MEDRLQQLPRPKRGKPRSTLAKGGLGVHLSHRGAERWRQGHPWIYQSDIREIPQLASGEAISVLDERGWFLGKAFYSAHSKISLRWLSYEDVPVDADFF